MAAAVIPLAISLIPEAVPLIVRLIDKIFGSKTGAVKLQTATTLVEALGQGLVNAGKASSADLPDNVAAQKLVQAVVDQLNAAGQLQGAATVIPGTAVALGGFQLSPDARLLLQILKGITGQ